MAASISIELRLDRRVPLQALVLQRLNQLPVPSQSEWLAQLLVQGFCSECELLRVASAYSDRVSPLRQRRGATGLPVRPAPPAAAFLPDAADIRRVPALHELRRVIGD